jgi:hypothetical protein
MLILSKFLDKVLLRKTHINLTILIAPAVGGGGGGAHCIFSGNPARKNRGIQKMYFKKCHFSYIQQKLHMVIHHIRKY